MSTGADTLSRGLDAAWTRSDPAALLAEWGSRMAELAAADPDVAHAAARDNGLSYSTLISGLKRANIEVNRKLLADLAVRDAAAFAKLAEVAKSAAA